MECLPQGARFATAGFRYGSHLLRAEFSARAHRAPGRGRGPGDRLFRAGRSRLALSQSRIPGSRSTAARVTLVAAGYEARLHCVSQTRACGSAAAIGTNDLVPYYDRGAIEAGALDGQKLEICWLKDPLDLVAIQIEGSARVILEDGTPAAHQLRLAQRLSYSSIERVLVERNLIPRKEMSRSAFARG